MKKFFGLLSLVLLGLIAILFARALATRSHQIAVTPVSLISVDAQQAAARLGHAVQIRTISSEDAPPNVQAFEELHAFLALAFPTVHSRLTREVVNGGSLLYTWTGSDPSLSPIVLMGHMDVVPVEASAEGAWTHPPFAGEVSDGYIWGRGTLDDKVGVLGVLEGAESLLQQNFQPRRTIYFAFGHDEEILGKGGARQLSSLLASRGVKPAYVMDEGGYIVHDLVPGHAGWVAFVNTAEKGYLTVAIRAEGAGGHSAAGSRQPRLPASTAATIDALAPEMPFGLKIAMANRWLLAPILVKVYAADPDTDALVRTTMAPTIFRAGIKANVLPRQAEAMVNVRLLPGDTIKATLDRMRKIVHDSSVTLEPFGDAYPAPPETNPEAPGFAEIAQSIREVAPGTLVVPGLVAGTSDSRFYSSLTPNILRFLPIELGPEDLLRIHGVNERISIANYQRAIQFNAQLLRNAAR
jgi:carboxypeptidase PM20D1